MVVRLWLGGVVDRPASLPGAFHGVLHLVPFLAGGGQEVTTPGGPQVLLSRRTQASFQGYPVGKCNVSRRAEEASRVGTLISVRRILDVVASANAALSVRVAGARVRLNAVTARANQAPLAVNRAAAGAPVPRL